MKSRPWIKINFKVRPPAFVCERCGKTCPVYLPSPVECLSKQADAFTGLHKDCEERGDENVGQP